MRILLTLMVTFCVTIPLHGQQFKCMEMVDLQLGHERAELQRLLAKHHAGLRIDARQFGLPANDFDDVTNLTLRQRRTFRAMFPDLRYPSHGPLMYPRWAFSFMNRLDREDAVSCNPNASSAQNVTSDSATASVLIGSNVNVS